MPALIFGVLVLVLALWALSVISKVDPRIAARVTKIGGGLVSLGLAVFLGLRGEVGVAIPLGVFGLGLARLGAVWACRLWSAHAEDRRTDVARTFCVL